MVRYAGEQIAQQANANLNKNAWGTIIYNVKAYGSKGDGINDDGENINATIIACSLAGGGTVLIPPGTYLTSVTLIVLPNVELQLTKGTIIKPILNIDVIQIKPNSILDGRGGFIDCSGVTGFTESAVYLNGVDQFGVLLSSIRTMIMNIGVSNEGKYTGSGIKFYCPVPTTVANFIQFVHVFNFDVFYFDKGIEVLCDTHAVVVGSWINGNIFDNFTITGCVNAISVTGLVSPYEATGNAFTNFQVQPLYFFSERAVIVSGSFNTFEGFVWDWNTDRQTIAFEVEGNANYFNTNIEKLNANKIDDQGFRTVVRSIIDSQVDIHYPSVVGGRVMSGDQDDYLAYAMKRFTVTSTVAPTGGILNNMFNPIGGFQCIWDSTVTGDIVIEIDMTADPIGTLQNAGIAFLFGNNAKNIKIEAFYSGAYNIVAQTTINYSNYFNEFIEGIGGVSKLKYTISGGNATNGIYVGRIFAQDSDNMGQTFLTKDGGIVYSDVEFTFNGTGVILKAPNGNRYRITVDNSGVLGTTLL